MKLPQLAVAHLALCVLVILWDLWVAGRASQLRAAPRMVVVSSGLAGLLLLPALAVHLLSGSLLTGHAFASIAWVWPLTVALVAAQALYATARGMLSPLIGIPIAVYDLLLALVYSAAYAANAGLPVTNQLIALVAAERGAIALGAIQQALILPWFLHIPIIAPCAPLRRGLAGTGRALMAVLALAWAALILAALPGASRAVHSYESFAAERLRERPDRDFTIGIKIFPTLTALVPTSSVQRDLAIADSIGTQALCIYISPRGASESELAALAETLEDVRGGRLMVVALDLAHDPPLARRNRRSDEVESYLDARVRDVARIARVLRPDYLVPVVNPTGLGIASGRLASGTLTNVAPASGGESSPEVPPAGSLARDTTVQGVANVNAQLPGSPSSSNWRRYITRAAHAARAANSATRVMVHVGAFGARDSALYAWAASSSSPVDAVALTLFPGLHGARDIQEAERTADAWLTAQRPASGKEHWILEAGGYPTAHGELSQARALWGILAWATNHPAVKGVIAFEASDYATRLGLQTPSGRLRLAAGTLKRAIAGLGEGE